MIRRKVLYYFLCLALIVLINIIVFFVLSSKPQKTEKEQENMPIEAMSAINEEPKESVGHTDLKQTKQDSLYETDKRTTGNETDEEQDKEDNKENNKEDDNTEEMPIIQSMSFQRLKTREIKIIWTAKNIESINYFSIARRKKEEASSGEWVELKQIEKESGKEDYDFIDPATSSPQQYEYKINIVYSQGHDVKIIEGEPFLASNLMICIDPGHFKGRNSILNDKYPYAEGDFTLELALELKRILYEEYGIDSYLTRENGDITIEGYSNQILDSQHISLRGQYAAKENSDLFLSLHTNANNSNVNGKDTWQQPSELNKPVIIANQIAYGSSEYIKLGNSIGKHIAAVSYQLGIYTQKDFELRDIAQIEQWTDQFNDSLGKKGTVLIRSKSGRDVYGVLRGASEVKIPGFIIEHGYHTVPNVRKEASEGNLKNIWAKADALGIAEAYHFYPKFVE